MYLDSNKKKVQIQVQVTFDKTGQMICVFADRTLILLVLSCRGSNWVAVFPMTVLAY